MTERAAARARELLTRAPVQRALWRDALEAIAEATGSRGAQLLGVSAGGVIANVCAGVPEALFEQWARAGGADGATSPLMRASQTAPLMTLLRIEDLLGENDRKRHAPMADLFAQYDVPHRGFVMLRREGDQRLSLCLFRSAAQGRIDDAAEDALMRLLPAVMAALDIQDRLNEHVTATTRLTLDALGHAAFVCDGWGRVVAVSAAGQAMADAGHPVTVRRDRLTFTAPSLARLGQAALTAATLVRAPVPVPPPQMLTAAEPPGHVVEVHALPYTPYDHGAAPACLVVVRPEQRTRAPLDATGVLTPAERAVAALLLRGDSTKDIADTRKVSLETVRWQIKSIYAKLHVAGRSEFMARFR